MTTSCFTLATTVVVPWDDFVWRGEAIVHATACPEDGGGEKNPQEWGEENVIPVVEECNQDLECRRQGVDNQPPSELAKGRVEGFDEHFEEIGHERNEHDRERKQVEGEYDFRWDRKISQDEKHVVDRRTIVDFGAPMDLGQEGWSGRL